MICSVQLHSESFKLRMYFSGESLCGGCNLAGGCLGVGEGFQESSWKNCMETGPAGKMSLRELVDIQISLLLRLKNNVSR